MQALSVWASLAQQGKSFCRKTNCWTNQAIMAENYNQEEPSDVIINEGELENHGEEFVSQINVTGTSCLDPGGRNCP